MSKALTLNTIFVVDVVWLLSCVWFFATSWTAACQTSLSFIISQSLLKLILIESVKQSNPLILCQPLLLLSSIFLSVRVFSYESTLHIRWPKYWSFSLSISPSNEYSGLIFFRIDWSPCSPRDSQESFPATRSKASTLWHSTQPSLWSNSHLYSGKTIS